ncbi:MAG: DUF2288 domain-containing protein [Kangiellaceae bacterium]|nr:DUF2288 domain-containing protein [Kangiellaceae bacterium]MCW8998008.1 DUF2288 domain-containing protein [Kangiellaceae bacterium]MCW9017769.1 DUF2288 domain-containing protein [Kangiellaceae bacterium]
MSDQDEELTLEQKLNLETAKIKWKELELFFAKGSLIRVEIGSDLVSVAKLVAENQHQEIEILIANKQIEFVTPSWAKKHCKSDTELWAVVVAPYVLCQPANDEIKVH